MAKFNIIGAAVVGGIMLLLTAWLITMRFNKDNTGSPDLVYIWAVVMGIMGYFAGGFIVGSLEKIKHLGITQKVEEDEDEDEHEDEDEDPVCCGC